MKKVALALFVLAACVPPADEEEPRGGVVARLVPSPETKGAPFTSVDGWTVTIERFAVRVAVQAERPIDEGYGYSGGGGYPRIVAPGEACELKATALTTGPASAYVELVPRYLGFDELDEESTCGLDEELRARFGRRADGLDPYDDAAGGDYRNGPSLVLVGRAEKAGRTIRLELALDASYYGIARSGAVPVTIVRNQGALVRSYVDAASLFVPPPRRGQRVRFDEVASADANGDGVVTGDELQLVEPAVCEPMDLVDDRPPAIVDPDSTLAGDEIELGGGEAISCGSLLDVLSLTNTRALFKGLP